MFNMFYNWVYNCPYPIMVGGITIVFILIHMGFVGHVHSYLTSYFPMVTSMLHFTIRNDVEIFQETYRKAFFGH